MRCLEQLVSLAAATGESLWVEGAAPDLAPALAQALQLYVDEAHVRTLAVIPLHAPQASTAAAHRALPLGALVFEWFEAVRWDPERRERVHAIGRHAATAVANARRHSRVPGSTSGNAWRGWSAAGSGRAGSWGCGSRRR